MAAALVLIAVSASAPAALIAVDSAADSTYDGGWSGNGGTGWGGAWSGSVSGPNGGTFVFTSSDNAGGSSGNIDTAGRSWGLYAGDVDGVGTTSAMTRPFSGSLDVGQGFNIAFDNGWIDNGSQGWNLRSGTTERLTFFFESGSANYKIVDNSGVVDTGVGFTGDGLNLEFLLTGTNSYSLKVTPNGGSATNLTGTLAASGGIDNVRMYNHNNWSSEGNRNAFFNSIAVTPEPASVSVLALAALSMLRRRKD